MNDTEQKALQRESWNTAAAGWGTWWRTLEEAAQVVSDRLIELAEIRAGHTILDVATGIGEPSITAARLVGPSGRVVATDQAPEMLRLGRERAAALRLGNIEFLEMDAEAPTLPAGSFDAVLCRWGLMFLPDIGGALGRLRGLLREGGRMATAAWGPAEEVPMIMLAGPILRERLGLEPPPPDALGPCRFAEPGRLEREFEKAGFSEIVAERFTVTFTFESAETYSRFRQDVSPQSRDLMQQFPAEQVQEVLDEITEAARRFAGPDGRVRMDNTVICVAGRR